jgi:RNA polymerase sigma factor (TIGR02999 family)
MTRNTGDVTRLLREWQGGDERARNDLLDMVYEELRKIAANRLRYERAGHTLEVTGLVHEAYLRLSGGQPLGFSDRAHFFRVAAQTMRRILVDYARRQQADKRIGAHQRVSLDPELLPGLAAKGVDANVLAVHEALEVLAQISPLQEQLIELRYFAGLTREETAEALGVSLSTFARNARVAERWLYDRLAGG